ncbi:RPII140-upstream gene protein [Chelonus insularis]|uniref:RPII140-upstream gene protein n=1 Tax=Chelonus insularis TaxID=460826 RepID=UPI00158C89D1|nr:RPII140-upstream gene protein [Chelonus insularis]
MSRYFRKLHPYHLAFLSGIKPSYDEILTPKYKDEKQPIGWEGIKALFKKDKNGEINSALLNLSNASLFCTLCGGLYGSALGSQKAFHDFIQNNDATKFPSHIEAKRKLQDNVFLGMGRHGLKWAIKVGSFSTVFMTTVTLLTAYLGGHGVTEYILAGSLTGTLYKINMGIRGMIAGCIVGTSLGSAAGVIFNFIFWLSGSNLRELSELQKEFYLLRKSIAFQSSRKDTAKEFGEDHEESEKKSLDTLFEEPAK